jgi:hypothetical protein
MRRVLLSLLAAALLAGTALAQCGPWGCPTRQPQTIERHREKHVEKTRPTPAWRYERAVGHRTSVVRIECWDGAGQWSKGSGVLVRWGKRVVVLTARHVIQDSKQVYVKFHNRKRHKAKVIKVDKRWDCAVLDIGDLPADIEPAELAYGADAMFHEGVRLETCGYGPDEKLAVNSGLFIGYRRTSETPADGPDDWMAVSGPARQGDSGGPVFDAKGRCVGILWGTDGKEVICVQPGRIHALLTEATAEQLAFTERRPTSPAAGPLEPVNPGGACCPDGQCAVDQTRGADKKPLLPWRQDAVADQNAQDRRIDRILDAMERQQKPGPSVEVQVEPKPPVEKPKESEKPPLWLWGVGGLLAAVGVYYVGQKN